MKKNEESPGGLTEEEKTRLMEGEACGICSLKLAHQVMLESLNELIPSDYADESLLAVKGISPQLLELDEPFDCSYQHFQVNDEDIFHTEELDYDGYEVCEKSDDSGFDDEVTAVCHETAYGRMVNPTMDDFFNAMELF